MLPSTHRTYVLPVACPHVTGETQQAVHPPHASLFLGQSGDLGLGVDQAGIAHVELRSMNMLEEKSGVIRWRD